jgi:flagellar motor component MotA
MACMDFLSEDTLLYEIMPYLDYYSRINFNVSLRSLHRRGRNLSRKDKNIFLKHEMLAITHTVISLVMLQHKRKTIKKRCEAIIKIVELLSKPRFRIILQYSKDFREAVRAKFIEYIERPIDSFKNMSESCVQNFLRILIEFIEQLDSIKTFNDVPCKLIEF